MSAEGERIVPSDERVGVNVGQSKVAVRSPNGTVGASIERLSNNVTSLRIDGSGGATEPCGVGAVVYDEDQMNLGNKRSYNSLEVQAVKTTVLPDDHVCPHGQALFK